MLYFGLVYFILVVITRKLPVFSILVVIYARRDFLRLATVGMLLTEGKVH